ncbi:hypothetical protein SEPCBS119000_003513 [Sporothrix epigloea]|uniref:HTH APSES-type domain-containing protein n=1 Tax=Sporothrix epigloea TaxID=1892477 RepID=A0ABP0DQQ4_9PEZI
MNQETPDMYYPSHHMQGGQTQTAPVPTNSMAVYNPHQQPPMLQPGPTQYPNPSPYNQYGYTNGLTSPPTAAPVGNTLTSNPHVLPLPSGVATQPATQYIHPGYDSTGQISPSGIKPRVTATLWEDEGSLCFQVEARGICVARREDNHMINGTKLLNVAGMTRGRRDGILKSEKVRHVVKIGPMHLKGVWIPFERALDFANKEKITEILFPLFVHNIASLLYNPANTTRTPQAVATTDRRKQESPVRNVQPASSGLPSLHQHTAMALPGPQQTLPSHANMSTPIARPPLDRAHTFPTPPTSASGVMGGGISASEPFSWSQQGVNGNHVANPMPIDTSLGNARSMPATPATTPPGPPMQSMQQYPPTTQTYDASRSLYHHQTPAPSSQHPSQQHTPHYSHHSRQHAYENGGPIGSPHDRNMYSHNTVAVASSYVKSEPTAPSTKGLGPMGNESIVEKQQTNGLLHHAHNGHISDGLTHGGVPEDEHEHEPEYTHDSSTYDTSRAQYNYGAPQVTVVSSEHHHHLSPDVAPAATVSHQATSGRSTPRSAASQAYYTHHGYNTPPRTSAATAAAQASSNLFNVVTNERSATNGGPTHEAYANGNDMPSALSNGYSASALNGVSTGLKRSRDDDDDDNADDRVASDMKRRKTLLDSSMPSNIYEGSSITRTASTIGAQRHR